MPTLANATIALVPVVLFLALLVMMDSFKLAKPSAIAMAVAWGVVAALISVAAQTAIGAPFSPAWLNRLIGPVTEETAKAVFIVWLILRRRIGFPVDAAQLGFAIGTGFALVENLVYLQVLPDASFLLWCARGLGTAVLHGATTAVFAMLAQTAADSAGSALRTRPTVFLPAWLAAVVIHAVFNLLPVSRLATTAALLMVLPMIVLWVFQRSERATREWIGTGLDLDLLLHETFSSDMLAYTRFGTYLQELRSRFPGAVVADMLCLLRVELELSIQAKVVLLARDNGMILPVHPDARAAVDEVRHLRASIGVTGLLALSPVQVTSRRDDWHEYLLTGSESPRGPWNRLTRLSRR